ncbi:putative oxidoreductase [Corynebacterium kutscheri]|uniref:Oxidoreductase n=1 Tax=Corynebacterium kutscheri TaxID=35755 RepID=A0AB38VR77_9CORY|nr:NAD(P)-dependent oxidoreductase [Corynebacterium kutscheri]VEH05738.1 putative oxidoreductase [Corynebacterium kutscheri]VEH81633.1 putative oxidoreductase [Corynebacterium kutscheri]
MIITVVGLGAMGLPMATNLAKTFSVRGVDIAEDRCALAQAAGIETFSSARDAARESDVVLLAVRNEPQLLEVLFGTEGIAEVMPAGAVVLLTSTVGMTAVEQAAALLAEKNLGLVDAPISGGPVRAGEGDLLVTAGGEPKVVESIREVLEAMASNLVIVGDAPGKGQALKTVNQLLCGVHIAAAGEALALADRLGLDPAAALDALMSGAAASFMLGDRGQRMLEAYTPEGAEVKSRLDIFVKDMGIVTAAAKKAGIGVPLAAAAEQQYLAGLVRGKAAQDDSSIITVVAPTQLADTVDDTAQGGKP